MTPQQFVFNLQHLIRKEHDHREGNKELLKMLESLRVSLNSNPLR